MLFFYIVTQIYFLKMKHLIVVVLFAVFALSCNSAKSIEKTLSAGNYNAAISDALNKLKSNKDKKPEIAQLLKAAYDKANTRDLNNIELLKAENIPANSLKIFETYKALNSRQEAVRAVLPLYVDGNEVRFNFKNYTNDLVASKTQASAFLYDEAKYRLNSPNKLDVRAAYQDFEFIESINPNYKDVRKLMTQAYHKGTDYVIVTIQNQTNQIIPRRLETFLLDFNTYGLDKFWTVFHAEPQKNLPYDYAMQLKLARINISPEQVSEKEILREKRIVDGWKYKLDRNGNVMKDSLGNDIKIDNIIDVRARLFQYRQFKTTQVVAAVVFKDLKSNQILDNFPIDSQFVFENMFATVRGDERALLKEDLVLLRNRQVPFPPNEQMIYDSGEDLKLQLKRIINSYKFK